MKKPIYNKYPNAALVRLHNRRVAVISKENIYEILICKICTKEEALMPIPAHEIYRGKVMITNFTLSHEAAAALYVALGEQLKSPG